MIYYLQILDFFVCVFNYATHFTYRTCHMSSIDGITIDNVIG